MLPLVGGYVVVGPRSEFHLGAILLANLHILGLDESLCGLKQTGGGLLIARQRSLGCGGNGLGQGLFLCGGQIAQVDRTTIHLLGQGQGLLVFVARLRGILAEIGEAEVVGLIEYGGAQAQGDGLIGGFREVERLCLHSVGVGNRHLTHAIACEKGELLACRSRHSDLQTVAAGGQAVDLLG